MDRFPRYHAQIDPERIRQRVDEAYRTVGHIMDYLEERALLVDALCLDAPIVGATTGFCQLTGYDRREVLGRNCRMMLQGVPEAAISKSSRKNVRDFCHMCQIKGLKDISETTSMQPNSRQDGSFFMNLFLLGLCMVHGHPYILSVQIEMGEGLFVRLRQDELAEAKEKARNMFKQIRATLKEKSGDVAMCREISNHMPLVDEGAPEFAFFNGRLQDHCLLVNDGFTAIRREPEEVASSCLVFGDRPLRKAAQGLSFRVRVDCATEKFVGFPLLGFTRRQPSDSVSLYPVVSKCLGASLLVGACGEAFARDQNENFNIGFKQPPQTEIQSWILQADVPPQRRAPPVPLKSGDVLQCIYTWSGRIQLLSNGAQVMDFDTGRPLCDKTDYYAVVDVCLAAFCVSILPSIECSTRAEDDDDMDDSAAFHREVSFATSVSFLSPNESEHDEDFHHESKMDVFDLGASASLMDNVVQETIVKQGIEEAISSCLFCVTVADPRERDCPLIAVSDEFERMTGFTREEALGVNCRFLNEGCDMNPEDLLNLRMSSKTGAPFTGVIPNRKKGGEQFLNLLDLRGLTIGKDPATGEDIWYLIGIQADVTAMAQQEIPATHLGKMQQVSDTIRSSVSRELADFTLAGVNHMGKDEGSFCVLKKPVWKPGSPLGHRRPTDLRAKVLAAEASAKSTPISRRDDRSGTSQSMPTGFGMDETVPAQFPAWPSRSLCLSFGVLLFASVSAVVWRKALKR
mmetsp:Transcript_74013/g.176164  ORF Transcript_74013/g.176164 Transcript_74013/m.176164 type:complete len:743 (+) Transcript_74013:148-2376(+)